MGRIEQINERIQRFDEVGEEFSVNNSEVLDILSRLQIAEEALDKIASHGLYPAGIAMKALEQIQKD